VARERFTVDHALGLWEPTGRVPLHLSPDGRHLALSARRGGRAAPLGEDQSFDDAGVPVEAIGSRVLVVDTATGATRAPFPDGSTSWGGQWSPDGTRLAAYVQHQGAACPGVWDAAGGAVRLCATRRSARSSGSRCRAGHRTAARSS
jgi:hypothetical protein